MSGFLSYVHCYFYGKAYSVFYYFLLVHLLFPLMPPSEADTKDIVSICLQMKEKLFHEMALLQVRDLGCYFRFKLGVASKKLQSIFCKLLL